MINVTQDYARSRILYQYLDIPNTDQANISRKWWGLKGFGYTDEQCERECRPKEIDRAADIEAIMEAQEKELKELAKINREQAKLRKREIDREKLRASYKGPEMSLESLKAAVLEMEGGLVVEKLDS